MADAVQTHVHIVTCPRCGKKAPEFNEQGKHNFCPASEGTKIIILCMDCKMEDVRESWSWHMGYNQDVRWGKNREEV